MICFLVGLCLLMPRLSGQEEEGAEEKKSQTIPNILRRPARGEAPRFPQDLVIGEMANGDASDEALLFARNLLSALTAGSTNAALPEEAGSVITESLREEINSIEPGTYRLGSGKIEPDGCVSFLVRFLGREESITGELFIRQRNKPDSAEERWLLDDLILEEKRALAEIRDSYRFDFSPYERFY